MIVGAVTIGDEALIAPNSYVNSDVPSRAVVQGNPAVIVSYNGVWRYIENTTADAPVPAPTQGVGTHSG